MESRLLPKVIIRMPAETKSKLQGLAASNHRTMTSEVIALIEEAAQDSERKEGM